MSVIPFVAERRRRRSSNTYEALKLQLEWIFENEDLRNFTLGDSNGLVMAYAGHIEESEVFAAYAPMLAKCTNKARYHDVVDKVRAFVPDAGHDSFAVRTFMVDGEELFLSILGEPGQLNHANVYRAVSGVRRIFDQSRIAA